MKRLLRWSLAVLMLAAVLFAGLAAMVALAIDHQPAADPASWRADMPPEITPAHIERAVQLFIRHDPRSLQPGAQDTLTITPADADLALNYFARRFAHTRTHLTLAAGTARLQTSTRLPATPLGDHLGVDLLLEQTDSLPRVASLRIGDLQVPAFAANALLGVGLAQLREVSAGAWRAVDSVLQVDLGESAVGVRYVWLGKLPKGGAFSLWPAAEQARIDAYTRVLEDAIGNDGQTRSLTLSSLMQPLLQAAASRSDAEGASAVAENRAALVALAQFVNAEALGAVFTSAAIAGPRGQITLNGRSDTAQHFTVSAAITAAAGAPMSDAIGLYKEMSDAQGGSGFSFNDLAADRAGTRFADRATASESAARRQQQAFAVSTPSGPAAMLLPKVEDLPENMQLPEFSRRFGSVDGPAALRVRADIERRLGGLPLYR
jgi:uncharacterized protein YfiM (DUF2279 family)